VVVASLLERIGDRWREGTLRPVHGHLATTVLRRVLDSVTETATVTGAWPKLVVATPVGQVHELGAMLAVAAAATEGCTVTYLGSGLPAEDIAEGAAALGAAAIGLSIVHPGGDRAIGTELRRLRSIVPKKVKLIVGGAAAASYQKVLDDISVERVGDLGEWRAQLRLLRQQAGHGTHSLSTRRRR
jgi:methanogenic corrinoid protein MtbC1